jgi:hypothetical protein
MYVCWDVFGDRRDWYCAKRQISRVIGITGQPKEFVCADGCLNTGDILKDDTNDNVRILAFQNDVCGIEGGMIAPFTY